MATPKASNALNISSSLADLAKCSFSAAPSRDRNSTISWAPTGIVTKVVNGQKDLFIPT